jgi:hypothetical protein
MLNLLLKSNYSSYLNLKMLLLLNYFLNIDSAKEILITVEILDSING